MALYELALMGAPSSDQVDALKTCITEIIEPFDLHLGTEVDWKVRPVVFAPSPGTLAAVAFWWCRRQ